MPKQVGAIFVVGILVGVFLVTGLGMAIPQTMEVTPEQLNIVIDGRVVVPSEREGYFFNGSEYVPIGFIYQGTTYLPLRLIAQELGKEITWDGESRTVTIGSGAPQNNIEDISFGPVDLNDAPTEVQEWVEAARQDETTAVLHLGDKTYLLVTRGEKPTGGYGVNIISVANLGDEILVTSQYSDPDPEQMVTQAFTYPYDIVEIERVEKPINFAGTASKIISSHAMK